MRTDQRAAESWHPQDLVHVLDRLTRFDHHDRQQLAVRIEGLDVGSQEVIVEREAPVAAAPRPDSSRDCRPASRISRPSAAGSAWPSTSFRACSFVWTSGTMMPMDAGGEERLDHVLVVLIAPVRNPDDGRQPRPPAFDLQAGQQLLEIVAA